MSVSDSYRTFRSILKGGDNPNLFDRLTMLATRRQLLKIIERMSLYQCDDCMIIFSDNTASRWPQRVRRENVCLDCFQHREEENEDNQDENGLFNHEANVLEQNLACFIKCPDEKIERQKGLWLGVELEVIANDRQRFGSTISSVHNQTKSWAILKEDASLTSGGFEIVSVPMSLRKHRELWTKFCASDAVKLIYSWSSPCTGVHVHVNRCALTPLTQGKLLVFIHEKSNQDFLNNLAGRNYNSFCVRGGNEKKLVTRAQRENRFGRYQALNFCNAATLEFRLFKGNVAFNGLMRYLEFTHALCTWCSNGASISDLNVREFCAWLGKNPADYPTLTKWCAKHLLIKSRHTIRKEVLQCA